MCEATLQREVPIGLVSRVGPCTARFNEPAGTRITLYRPVELEYYALIRYSRLGF
jgi:hypothetical protein